MEVDNGEENKEEVKELNTGRVQRKVEAWKKRMQKERKMASEEFSKVPAGESGAVMGEIGETFCAAIEVSCKCLWRVFRLWLPEARPVVMGNAALS